MLKRVISSLTLCGLLLPAAARGAVYWDSDFFLQTSDYCQILDDPSGPLYHADLTYIPRSGFGSYGKSETIELGVDWSLACFRDVFGSDLALDLDWQMFTFPDSTSLQLPDQLMSLSIDSTLTWRYHTGRALQVAARPGIYSDWEDLRTGMFLVPVSCSVICAFDRSLSAQGGLELRPGFGQVVMPLLMVKYEPDDFWLIEAGLPSTRVSYSLDREWTAYGGFDWRNTSFALHDKRGYDRDRATLEDFSLYGGMANQILDQLRVSVDFGLLFGRSIEFKHDVPDLDSKVDIDSMVFLRLAVSGPF